jgi:hypothetical protein
MFSLLYTTNGKVFSSWSKNGVKKLYATVSLALNAAHQLANNPKNHFLSGSVIDEDDGKVVATAKVTKGVFSFEMVNKEVASVKKEGVEVEQTVTPKKAKVIQEIKKESVKDTKKTVPIESLFVKDETRSKVDTLMECHKNLTEKSKPVERVVTDSEETDLRDLITPRILSTSIMMKDYQTLLQTQIDLLHKGYFWSVGENKEIVIKPLHQVLADIKKK